MTGVAALIMHFWSHFVFVILHFFHLAVVGLYIWGVDLHLHAPTHSMTGIITFSAFGQTLNCSFKNPWTASVTQPRRTFLSSWRQQLPGLLKCSHSPWFDLQSLFVFAIDHTRGFADWELCFPFGVIKIFQCLFQSPPVCPRVCRLYCDRGATTRKGRGVGQTPAGPQQR